MSARTENSSTAVLYWNTHPSFKPWFLAAMGLCLLNFILFMTWAIRWYFRALAAQKLSHAETQPDA